MQTAEMLPLAEASAQPGEGRPDVAIDLYWLPLGAGRHSVRLNGKVFEAVAAWLGRRDRCDLYYSASQAASVSVA
jgi:hypothetical protein